MVYAWSSYLRGVFYSDGSGREPETDTDDDNLPTAEEWIEEHGEASDWAKPRDNNELGNAFYRNYGVAKKILLRNFLPLVGKAMQDKKVFQLRGHFDLTGGRRMSDIEESRVYGSRVPWIGSTTVQRGDIFEQSSQSSDQDVVDDDSRDYARVDGLVTTQMRGRVRTRNTCAIFDMGIECRFVGSCWTKCSCSFRGMDTYITVV